MDVSAEDHEVADALYSLLSLTVRRMPRDISLTTAATLFNLERHGPQRITQLAMLEGVAQPSMTALVTRLENDGLAQRLADPADGRGVLVALTDAGERYVTARRLAGAANLATLIAQLSADEVVALQAAVPAIIRLCALERGDDDAKPGSLEVP